jgi:hypothetical protein
MNAQNRHLRYVKSYSFLLIVAAGLGTYGIDNKASAIGAALVIIGSIFISILMVLKNDEDTWYRARAVAESVKTSAWRFMMRGEPYTDSHSMEIVKSELRGRLKSILNEHRDLSLEICGEISEEEQITAFMCEIRNKPLLERVAFYRKHRIDEQRGWYARKSAFNRRNSKTWFSVLVGCQAIAVVLVILRVAYPEWRFWPTEIFLVAAGSALTWIQVKRFRELASAYGLTAHEIGVIRGELEDVTEESHFSQFVTDSESAFSREHTQWLARKDVV